MQVRLAYGTSGLVCDFPPDVTTVIEPEYRPALPDPVGSVMAALAAPTAGPPLSELARGARRVAISVCDATRPQPRALVLPPILSVLERHLHREQITILIATGTHRGNTRAEQLKMFGGEIVERYCIINHDARDDASLVKLGTAGNGVPIELNRNWVDADLRITTGFVEPHFFAGFSGGPKLVAPGLAGLRTVMTLHDAARIGHANATWGITEGNPVHDDIRAVSRATGVSFALDVLLNRDKGVTDVFAGELFAMHAAACVAAKSDAMRAVPRRFEVVVTTNSGFPLDQNLYQCVKGMAAAARVVQPGGTIICAAECRDGLPEHGSYAQLLAESSSAAELLERIEIGPARPDQWQVQVQARIQAAARVLVHTDGLSDGQLRAAHVEPAADVAESVREALARAGPQARVCVLPEGPVTIPYVATED